MATPEDEIGILGGVNPRDFDPSENPLGLGDGGHLNPVGGVINYQRLTGSMVTGAGYALAQDGLADTVSPDRTAALLSAAAAMRAQWAALESQARLAAIPAIAAYAFIVQRALPRPASPARTLARYGRFAERCWSIADFDQAFYAPAGLDGAWARTPAGAGLDFTRAGTERRDGPDGRRFSFASGVPAVIERGLLREAAEETSGAIDTGLPRRNLLFHSVSFSALAWTGVNASIVLDAGYGEDGAARAAALTDAAAASAMDHEYRQTVTLAGGDYVLAADVRAGSKDIVYLRLSGDAAPADATVWFDLAAGAVGVTGADVVAAMTDMGGGVWRCEAGFSATAGSVIVTIGAAFADGATGYPSAAGGVALYLARPQLRLASDDTAYVATLGAARLDGPAVLTERTNHVLWSGDLSQAAWDKNSATVTGPDPSGLCAVMASAVNGSVYQTVEVAAGRVGARILVRRRNQDLAQFRIADSNSLTDRLNVIFNFKNGAVTLLENGAGVLPQDFMIRTLGSGIYEISGSVECVSGGLRIQCFGDVGGDGAGATDWGGAQIEHSAFPTPWIETAGAAVTAPARHGYSIPPDSGDDFATGYFAHAAGTDDSGAAVAAAWLRGALPAAAGEYAVFVEFTPDISDAALRRALEIYKDDQNFVSLGYKAGEARADILSGGVTETLAVTSVSAGARTYLAFRMRAGETSLSVNDSEPVSGAAAAPASAAALNYGANGTGVAALMLEGQVHAVMIGAPDLYDEMKAAGRRLSA